MPDTMSAAAGRWPELLMALAALSSEQLSNRHQPCPACGGTDRYRWDRDDGPGGWFCNRCGGKDHAGGAGSGLDLLMRVRGWSLTDALTAVGQHLGLDRPIPPPPVEGAEAWWQYSPTVVVRRLPGKDIRPLTYNGTRWELKAPAKPRPLYWPRRRAGLPVLVVEGEKTADAAAALFPSHAVVTWMGGCKAVHLADWQQLASQQVTLWPDADDVGRQAMAKLAALLVGLGASVAIVQPDAAWPAGWDLADADWSQPQAAAELTARAKVVQPLSPVQPATQQAQPQAAVAAYYKPQKLEAVELLAMLRNKASDGGIRFNRYSQQVEINGAVIEGAERFYLTIAEQGYKVSKDLAFDCLIQVAKENPYDPVLLYLEHVAATVEPAYIGGLATAYLRPEDQGSGPTLYDHMLCCTLIGAVRRVFEPGCKHDTACVLMGDQGAQKSSFWSALGGAFFSDALGDISSKDDLMVLHRSWIMEWAELDHIMGRRHAGQIKSFLSQSTDLFRVPYGKATEAFPRRGIIVGSTNRQTGFLQDDTGNRRFWVIPTTRTEEDPIDTSTLMAERDAIWSAAVHAYRAGEASYLPAHLAAQVSAENEGYRVENPWMPAVQQWLRKCVGEQVTSERILLEAIQKPTERQTRADQMAVADILCSLGYVQRRVSQGGSRVRLWIVP